jgi:hypothetical protein
MKLFLSINQLVKSITKIAIIFLQNYIVQKNKIRNHKL